MYSVETKLIRHYIVGRVLLRYKHNNLQKLMSTQSRQWNACFQFCSFFFDADFATKHAQLLINKVFPDFCNKDIDSLTLFLRLFF